MGWIFIIFVGGGVLFGRGVGGDFVEMCICIFRRNRKYGYGLVLLYERCGLAQKGAGGMVGSETTAFPRL